MLFRDRADAGRQLAERLEHLAEHDPVVLGLPRGGVPVAAEVARALGARLDIFLVRKLGAPLQEELAIGAIASGGVRVVNQDVIAALRVTAEELDTIAAREQVELDRRERHYRGDRIAPDVTGRVVVLVDDGLATGASMRAAVTALRRRQPSRIVVAVPVGAAETCAAMAGVADEVVCAATPFPFSAVGQWYVDFRQTSDEEVIRLLR